MTVWIDVNTSRDVGDVNHLKVFATELAANRWARKTTRKALLLSIWSGSKKPPPLEGAVTIPHVRNASLSNWRYNLARAVYLAAIAVATLGWLWLLTWMVKQLV